jgi:excinuclease ABC subunit C
MMREVLSRRFATGKGEGPPDLIVVDGGPGQLNVLTGVMRDLNITGVAAAGLAKSRVEKGMAKEEIERSKERIYLPGRKNPLVLRRNSAPLLLLTLIRDEAHRFALSYHKKVRSGNALESLLSEIPGVGEKRGKALLTRFGSLKGLKSASVEEIAKVTGITRILAEKILGHLHGEAE